MEQNDEIEIDLLQLLNIVKKNLLSFMAICIFTCALGFGYSKFLMKETFTATAKIIIVKQDNGTSTSNNYTYSDVQLSQKLASTYSQIIMSEAVSDDVIKNLGLDIDSEKYNKIVTVSSADQTEVMNISAKTNDPKLSSDIANEVVNVFVSKIYDIMDVQNVTILNDAKVPTKKSGPSVTKYTAIGGVVGILICGIIALIKLFTDTKVKTEEEVRAIFPDYPIISTIPDFMTGKEEAEDE